MKSTKILPKYSKETCLICGNNGTKLYEGLKDQLFGAPDSWNITKCNTAHCGLLWLDPQPGKSILEKLYENYYTHTPPQSSKVVSPKHSLIKKFYIKVEDAFFARKFGYSTEYPHFIFHLASMFFMLFPVSRAAAEFKIMNLPFVEQGKLLEIGCGNGKGLKYLASKMWTVEGLDFDHEAVNYAKLRGLNVSIGELSEQQYAENSFDAIIMSHVIEHVIDPKALLHECLRILKPNGYCMMATPNSLSVGHYYYKQSWRGLEPPRHLHIFNPNNLQKLCKLTGFSEVQTTTTLRDTMGMLSISHSLLVNGKPNGTLRFIDKVKIYLLSLYERFLLLINKPSGEEFFIICRK